MTSTHNRTAETAVPVHPLLAERWSPRGFEADHELSDQELRALLEAARWSPSASNTQPWRFLVARRGSAAFDELYATLNDGNRVWAGAASALVLATAETVDDEGRERRWAEYDTGQAVAHLTIQAHADGLAVHQMGGFDRAAVAARFGLPDRLSPLVVIAIGRHDPTADLPEPYRGRERAARTRRPLTDLLLD